MDCQLLTGENLDLSDYRLGAPQQAGNLTVLPITTAQPASPFVLPACLETASSRASAGPALLRNDADKNCVLAPLHAGLAIGDKSGRLMSSAALAPPAERRDLSAEIAYLYRLPRREAGDPAIGAVLPLALRGPAWRRRGQAGAVRLGLNDLQERLHRHHLKRLPSILLHPELRTLPCRIELIAGQTGALFFIEDRPVGLEIAPSPAYFQGLWLPLLTQCYGLAALLRRYENPPDAASPDPFAVSSLAEMRTELFRQRHAEQERLTAAVAARSTGAFAVEAGQRWRNYRLHSLTGRTFGGQYLEEITAPAPNEHAGMPKMLRNLFRKGTDTENVRHRIIYASLFALE